MKMIVFCLADLILQLADPAVTVSDLVRGVHIRIFRELALALAKRGFSELGVSRPVRVSPEMGRTDKKAFVKLLSGFGGVNGALLFRKGGAAC